MRRALSIATTVVLLTGAVCYLSIRKPLHRATAAIQEAQQIRISRHTLDAFVSVLVNSPGDPAELRESLRRSFDRSGYPAPEKTLRRRFAERAIATIIAARYDDHALLRAYLNQIYLGHAGSGQIIGVREASLVFFRSDIATITVEQAALLAAVHQSPNVLSPLRHPERAILRRNAVLARMLRMGFINQGEYEVAVSTPLMAKEKSQ